MSKCYVGDVATHGIETMSEMINLIKSVVDMILLVTGVVLTVTVHEGQTVCPGNHREPVFTIKVMYDTTQATEAAGIASVTLLYQRLLSYSRQAVVKVSEVTCFMIRPMSVTTD